MLPSKFATVEQFEHDMRILSRFLHAGELKIVGGEPLLHKQLIDFLKVARDIAIADRIILLTNGTLLHKAPEIIWELIDGMWISIYPGIKYKFDFDGLQEIANEHGVWVWKKETPKFVRNQINNQIADKRLVRLIYQNCLDAHFYSCHTIHEGRYYLCQPAVFVEARLEMLGIAFHNKSQDSIQIHDNPNLHIELKDYIRKRDPLAACSYCLGSWARFFPHHQLDERGIKDWLAEKHDDITSLFNPDYVLPLSFR